MAWACRLSTVTTISAFWALSAHLANLGLQDSGESGDASLHSAPRRIALKGYVVDCLTTTLKWPQQGVMLGLFRPKKFSSEIAHCGTMAGPYVQLKSELN